MITLIPAYQPDSRLVALIRMLRAADPQMRVLVVDDGSGAAYASIFDGAVAAGAEVLGYEINRGKGVALRTGLLHVIERHPTESVVCADSDGQHRVTDILRVADRLRSSDAAVVLGGRRFAGEVPARSRFGNAVSRRTFQLATGIAVYDTQTGLRGYPAEQLPWLTSIKGDRFEFELNALVAAAETDRRIDEIEIETVYLEHNASSHFRPVVDSVRVMAPLGKYVAASLGSFVLDTVVLQVLFIVSGSLFWSVVGARMVSATANFTLNRRLVFRARGDLRRSILRYGALALTLLASNYVWLHALTDFGVPLLPAKVATELVLYVIGFQVQRGYVFARGAREQRLAARATRLV
ncbi:MAG: bifunctional glycosyltransferase family 2/GtrA family protein [Pseudolysinimonas sp.]